MESLININSLAIPLIINNIDTDLIIPSREMKSVSKSGLSKGLFAGWRYKEIGSRDENPDFVLNNPKYASARILLTGENMGCGSSREHAAWALAEYGIKVIIAPSFNPIFRGNCIRNGILPLELNPHPFSLMDTPLRIDLPAQRISAPTGETWTFTIEEEAKRMLVEGLDPIDLTLQNKDKIAAFKSNDKANRPWIHL